MPLPGFTPPAGVHNGKVDRTDPPPPPEMTSHFNDDVMVSDGQGTEDKTHPTTDLISNSDTTVPAAITAGQAVVNEPVAIPGASASTILLDVQAERVSDPPSTTGITEIGRFTVSVDEYCDSTMSTNHSSNDSSETSSLDLDVPTDDWKTYDNLFDSFQLPIDTLNLFRIVLFHQVDNSQPFPRFISRPHPPPIMRGLLFIPPRQALGDTGLDVFLSREAVEDDME